MRFRIQNAVQDSGATWMCIQIRNTAGKFSENCNFFRNLLRKRKLFTKTIPGTKIFRENFRDKTKFRERWANFCFFSLFAKMKKGVFVSTLSLRSFLENLYSISFPWLPFYTGYLMSGIIAIGPPCCVLLITSCLLFGLYIVNNGVWCIKAASLFSYLLFSLSDFLMNKGGHKRNSKHKFKKHFKNGRKAWKLYMWSEPFTRHHSFGRKVFAASLVQYKYRGITSFKGTFIHFFMVETVLSLGIRHTLITLVILAFLIFWFSCL
jgi:hypothetical protein